MERKAREGRDVMNPSNGGSSQHFQESTFVKNGGKKESFREKFKSCILSHLCTRDKFLHEVGVLFGLTF